MFDLKAGVHFEEVKALARRVCTAHDQLNRTGGMVIHRCRQGDGLLTHRLAHFGGDEWRRSLLHHFLVTALNAALTLVQIKDIAVFITQDLDFDMARVLDEFLDENAVITEGV